MDEKQLRRRLLAAFHQDGLAEIILGSWLLTLGLSVVVDAVFGFRHLYVMSLGPLAALTALYPLLKTRITQPRIGYFRIPDRQTRRLAWTGIAVGIGTLLLLAALIVGGNTLRDHGGHAFIFSFPLALSGTAFGLGGIKLANTRWLVYAGICVVSWIAGLFVIDGSWLTDAAGFCIAGGTPVVGGLITLGRFLHHNPVDRTGNC